MKDNINPFFGLKESQNYFEQIIQEMLHRFLKKKRFLNEKRYEIPFRITLCFRCRSIVLLLFYFY